MRQSHLILVNAAVLWASQILLLVPQLILVPCLIGTIGEPGYGVYVLVWSLMIRGVGAFLLRDLGSIPMHRITLIIPFTPARM